MITFSKKFLLIYNGIFFILFFIILLYTIKIFCNINKYTEFYIIHETKENRFIEYYPNIIFLDYYDFLLKEFAYKEYELFCYCNNLTNYRIYDKKLCLTSDHCDPSFHLLKENYNLKFFSIWNKKRIYDNKQIYNFFQGINSKGVCDNNYKYKKCGFLLDLNIDFCVKENDECPFNDNETNFYLYNLTNDIILTYEDHKIKIFNDLEIKDFLPDLKTINKSRKYDVVDSSNIYKIVFENNIPYLKETINDTMKNIQINLTLLKFDDSDIKYNQNFFQEKIVIKTYEMSFLFFYNIYIYLLFLTIGLILSLKLFNKININIDINRSLKKYLCILFTKVVIIMFLALNIFNEYYYEIKQTIDTKYIFNNEYYSTLKDLKILILDIILIFIISEYNLVLIIIKYYKDKCKNFCCNKNKNYTQFVDIQ